MVVIKCPIRDCNYQTPDESSDIVCVLLNLHKVEHDQQSGSSNQPAVHSAPKLNRPMVDMGIDQETWLAFIRRWETFRVGSNISEGVASIQLFQCASEKLGNLMLANDPRLMAKSVDEVTKLMESIAVIKVAIGVKRAELMGMSQDHDEPFRTFATRVRSKAETCNFTTMSECQCGRQNITSYTEEAIKDVMLAGVGDDDIRREVLSTEDILSRSSNEIISCIESKEMGRHATESSRSVSAVSSFQRQKKGRAHIDDKSHQAPCQTCGKLFNPLNKKGGQNAKPFKYCLTCWRSRSSRNVNAVQIKADDGCEFVQQDSQVSSLHVSTNIMLNDRIFDKNTLRRAKVTDHPRASVKITKRDTNKFAWVSALADSGAQSNLWGWKDCQEAGFCREDLTPVTITIRAANKNQTQLPTNNEHRTNIKTK